LKKVFKKPLKFDIKDELLKSKMYEHGVIEKTFIPFFLQIN